jgi:hypothetical protein
MSKICLFSWLLLISSFISDAQKSNCEGSRNFFKCTLTDEMIHFYDNMDSGKYELVKEQCLDSIKRKRPNYEELYKVAACAYQYLDQMDSAFFYAHKYIDVAMESSPGMWFNMDILDHLYCYKVASDKSFQQYVLKKSIAFYVTEDLKCKSIAIALAEIRFVDQLIRYQLDYIVDQHLNAAESYTNDTVNQNRLLTLLRGHGYYTLDEVGPVYDAQNLIFWHINDWKKREYTMMPIILKAYNAGLYSCAAVINQIIKTEGKKGTLPKGKENYTRFVEELKKKYSCTNYNAVVF